MTISNSPNEHAVPVALPAQAETALASMVSTSGCDFAALTRAAGLDPARDFRGADLRGVDFGTSDLRGFDFSGADLSGCDLSQAKLDGTILTGARRGSGQRFMKLRGHEGWVNSVAFSPDGSRIVSGGDDGTLRLWDATTGARPGEPLRGHDNEVVSVAFSPDGSRIVSGGGDIRIAISAQDNSIRLWDAATGTPLGAPQREHKGCVRSVAFSPDGSRIVSGGDDRTLRLWDAATGAALGEPLRGHEGRGLSVAFSPDGRRIVSGGADGTLRLWDAATGAPLGEPLRGHEGRVVSVAFSPDGNRIVSGGDDRTLRPWDATTGVALGEPLRGHEGAVFSVAFSPDGSRIVSGGKDGTLRLWDATTGAALGEPLRGHEDSVSSVAFSPDGSRIASGSIDRKVIIWFLDPPVHQVFVTVRPEDQTYSRNLLNKLFAHPQIIKRNVVEAVLDPRTHPRPEEGARDALENSVAALFIVGDKDLALMQHGELALARQLQRKTGQPRIIPVFTGDKEHTSLPTDISEYDFVRDPINVPVAFDQLVQSICFAVDRSLERSEIEGKQPVEWPRQQENDDAGVYSTAKGQSRAARKQRIQINRDG